MSMPIRSFLRKNTDLTKRLSKEERTSLKVNVNFCRLQERCCTNLKFSFLTKQPQTSTPKPKWLSKSRLKTSATSALCSLWRTDCPQSNMQTKSSCFKTVESSKKVRTNNCSKTRDIITNSTNCSLKIAIEKQYMCSRYSTFCCATHNRLTFAS